jgi:hypothetical protein
VHGHRRLVLTFDDTAAALYRRIAGRWLMVNCVRFDRHPRGFEVNAGGGSMQRAPRRQRPIPVVFNRRYDVCTVRVPPGRRPSFVTRIPLTALGAERLDERNTAVIVVAAVRLLADPERPSAATVAAQLHGVALASPAEVPPPGLLGIYSDGAEHVYAAQLDRSGDLLFVDLEGDVTRTNVLGYLLGEDPFG